MRNPPKQNSLFKTKTLERESSHSETKTTFALELESFHFAWNVAERYDHVIFGIFLEYCATGIKFMQS